ncbi:hypothetical protein Poli38472_008277 [Pythium oligandrum]|uniref:Calcineurin-like phosphoesterase domain-containing protein n=1 Tax=Pythium oligandrum TaxID=41045 RepID=A0A8K1CLU2_PYTOL|nr:hypothetical protein Poli38472_008277 [Pythium oligandrum]|eukprot:TMW65635.1 hypothetical protein Poli38472_008277 [Pythium oligandrum]
MRSLRLVFVVLCAFVGGFTAAQVVQLDEVVVTDVRVVVGNTIEDVQQQCESNPFKQATSSWSLAGGNLNSALGEADLYSKVDKAYVYLCVRQDPLGGVQANPATIFAAQSIHVLEASSCPSSLRLLYQPRSNIVICVAAISAQVAYATGMYISDITTVGNTSSSGGDIGWTTAKTSVETDPRVPSNATSSSASSVFLAYKRPARPITGVHVLSKVYESEIFTACATNLGSAWEQAGSGFLTAKGCEQTIVCVERPNVPLADVAKADTLVDRVLVDISIVETSANCPNTDEEKEVLSDAYSLCFQYSNASAPTYIGDLVLESIDALLTSAHGSANVLSVLPMSSDFDVASTSDLNLHNRNISTYLTYRSYPTGNTIICAENATKASITSAPKDPLLARLAESTNSTERRLSYKIVQLADLHLTGDPAYVCQNPPDELKNNCTEVMTTVFVNEILDTEQPDFVVFTGDTITVEDSTLRTAAIETAFQTVESRKIPYAVIMGNHDDDNDFPREEIGARIIGRPYSYMERGPRTIFGVGNYALNVQAPVDGPWGSNGRSVFRMYFLDSNKHPDTAKYPDIDSEYDWIRPNQIEYYRQLSLSNRLPEGPTPAIMFFHIPIPEYNGTEKINGEMYERVHSPGYNSGLFNTLVELDEVKATFAGHDHTNEYCTKRESVQLCYGGGTGFGESYSRDGFARRARVIEWSINAENQRQITSWKRHYGANFTERQLEEVLYTELS